MAEKKKNVFKMFYVVIVFLCFFCFSIPQNASAYAYFSDEDILKLSKLGARTAELTPQIVEAVMRQESGGKPYCINNNTKKISKCFSTKQEAIDFIYKHKNANIDIGLMQVNYKAWRSLGYSPEQLLDPIFNVKLGSLILKHYMDRFRGIKGWHGVGCYNAGERGARSRQMKYIYQVHARYKKILDREKRQYQVSKEKNRMYASNECMHPMNKK